MGDLKCEFLRRFGITARQFNAIRVGLEGKIASIRERLPEWIAEAESRIQRAERAIRILSAREPGSEKLHQKKRRLGNLRARLAALIADRDSGRVRFCFGSRRLFRKQFHLKENGYASHAEWKKDWQSARSAQFFVIGSKDETAGNQSCQASVEEDGSVTLRLRLPDALASDGKLLVIPGVRFAYGQEEILQALAASRVVLSQTKGGKPARRRDGVAVSYRFVRDRKGWRVFSSVPARPVPIATSRLAGAVGIDINHDHLAVAETDRFGNLRRALRVDLNLYGKTEDQAKAIIGDAARMIVEMARERGLTLVLERLDLKKRRAELEVASPSAARKISSFCYSKTISLLKAGCFRAGVEGIEVDPAYTSVMGAMNHARRHGISSHQSAAYAVARRGLGLSQASDRAGGRPRRPAQWRPPHLCPTREESGEACVVVLVGGSEEAQSGVCIACPVGRLARAARAFAPGNAGIGRNLGIAGGIPAREPSAEVFGRRRRRPPLVVGWLSMVLGTV